MNTIRFSFGRNWKSFVDQLSEAQITSAQISLSKSLKKKNFRGLRFLDAGCGSALFSLAAKRLGAEVLSFDYDQNCVFCAENLKEKYFPNDAHWQIAHGSVLDERFLETLGEFDIVYSWGVLHHTGELEKAMNTITGNVGQGGILFIGLYNDQGVKSRIWKNIKAYYNLNSVTKYSVILVFFPLFFLIHFFSDLKKGKNPFDKYRETKKRGMSMIHDWYDWLGGYPFEVITPKKVTNFYKEKGFALLDKKITSGLGVNEFIFERI